MNNKDIAEYIARTLYEKRLIHEELTVEQAVEFFYNTLKDTDRALSLRRPVR